MGMKSAAIAILAAGLAAVSASAAPRPGDLSWGKPGVSLEEYAIDGALCAYRAASHDVSDTQAARRLVAATRRLELLESQWGSPSFGELWIDHRRIVEGVRPERLFEQVAGLQQLLLDECLTERGYRQFRLTAEQKRHLRRLERGSNERRAYLHSLGSDPQILNRQRIDAPVLTQPQG